ncbi:L-alanine-DL-glutamate epimerase [Marinitoga sp. 1135]|uniref:Dipeptide epimerase n=1 Tax=Marinitoga piezophila (strain DSM 14283 / JCM 11233 / KA3) TaxID=443254 RepID=H2J5J6_MARPK|nr:MULTISPECIES: L-Ala-D/L-Glu epimerase [Marinitoga]AEX86140.1 enolase superfamily enzyme related to L-alanine-DL-glutamate epimerase [Marinitoga piezophila KA3]APT76555.1 L-alanine-DL-glutamate epimerase [Marinitoga sp. 1137]NUU96324.1 L-alanine-DL-glutamate epimerase [Marinitoga sp. 1135]NUU98242.1 L-alanine-DL-glutamate epimerase [Marinitoga sp. 1138]
MSKIKKITFEVKKYEFHKPFHVTGSISNYATNIEVVLETEDGAKGYGEASPSFRVNGEKVEALYALESSINELLVGMEVRNYRQIFDLMDKYFASPSIKAAVQYATLDAFSEEINVPVYQILGGARTEIEIDKTVSIDTVENMVRDAVEIYNAGHRVIKIKVGEDLKKDIEAVEEIAKLTSGAKYIVDANMGYTPKEAIEFAKVLYSKGIDLGLLEQPVKATDFEGLKFVRYNCPFPVGADESAKTKYDIMRLIKMEAVDFINIKLMKSGISDALAIVEMVKSAHLQLMIGCMGESSVGINQSVNFALGTGAFVYHDLDSALLLKEDTFRGKYISEPPVFKGI